MHGDRRIGRTCEEAEQYEDNLIEEEADAKNLIEEAKKRMNDQAEKGKQVREAAMQSLRERRRSAEHDVAEEFSTPPPKKPKMRPQAVLSLLRRS